MQRVRRERLVQKRDAGIKDAVVDDRILGIARHVDHFQRRAARGQVAREVGATLAGGAFSGSVCGRRLSGKPASTIGFERRHNAAFRIEDEDAFVQFMLEDIPVPPPRAAELRGINAGLAVP